jgi:tetratricopeptide (TPR) repeat protein
MNLRARHIYILVCLGIAAPAFGGEPQWVEIHSPHFSVVTDAGEKHGRDAAARFEQMRAVFGTLMVNANVNTPIPLQIIAFRNNKELRQFAPIWQGKATQIAGLFVAGSDRCYILLDMSLENPWQVVFHEYAHQLMNGTLSMQLDSWFEEGFAEYFRGIVVNDKEAEVGRVPEDESYVLDHTAWMKVADLLRVQPYSKTYNENGDRRNIFYAESGILVHYIYDNALMPKVVTYFDLVRNRHVTVEDAIQQAFGMSAPQLDKELHNYANSGHSKGYRLAAPAGIDSKGYSNASLEALNAQTILADVHLHSPDYQKSAEEEFEAVLKIDPNNAAALRGLGYSYLIKQDFAKAADYFHKSSQLNPNDPRVLYYSALLSQRQASSTSDDKLERLQSMQSELERAIKLDPQFADAYSLLAFTYRLQGKSDAAIPVLRRAIELSPRNEQYQLNLAQLCLEGKRFDEAISILRVLQSSNNPRIAARSSEELGQVQKLMELARAAPEPAKRDVPTESVTPRPPVSVPEREPETPKIEVATKEVSPSSEGTPVFHASTSLVLVDVLTQDSKTGLPLNELKKDDFRMLDNGHQVSILTFDSGAHFGTRPIVLWFVMICNQKNWDENGSGFMRNKALLLRPALDHLDKRDTVGVAHWCDNGQEAIDLVPTADRDAPIAQIEEVQHRDPTEAGTRVGELSVQRMLRLIIANARHTNPEPLPVIVFLYGDFSGMPHDEANAIVDDLLETSAFVYGINDGGFPLNSFPSNSTYEQFYIAHYFSKATAGQFFSVKPALFATALDDILVQVHFRYQLGFKPPALDGKRHDLTVALTAEVKAQHKSVRLVHRSEYIPAALPH